MSTNKTSVILLTSLLSLSALSVSAAPPSQQEQLDQSRAQEAERQERLGEERAQVVMPPPPPSDLPADESVRFHISHVTIEHQTERFCFLERITHPVDEELSLNDINKLNNAMNQSLMARGFSTSRIVVPEQNLFSEELHLFLQIGYIGTVRFTEDSAALYWKNLFPFHEGDILNVPNIEQGIKETKCLPSQINHRGQMSCLQYRLYGMI